MNRLASALLMLLVFLTPAACKCRRSPVEIGHLRAAGWTVEELGPLVTAKHATAGDSILGDLVEYGQAFAEIDLDLSGSQVTDAGLATLAALSNLRQLDLSGTAIGDAGLATASRWSKLEQLKLVGTGVTDAGLAHLSACGQLTGLWLSKCEGIHGPGLAHLAGLELLETLKLDGTGLASDGLATLPRLAALGSVDLRGTQVDDAGLLLLKDQPSLEEVWAGNMPNVTEAGCTALEDANGSIGVIRD